ncbi:Heat shock 70 kDa protein 15 [Forsythia ovata]|uniref:Heat shock 70 kDa protein 15 n=1 Tax=Forsythia ovata TaxID=205694 RepID=A0ABD1PWP5_9LAMI
MKYGPVVGRIFTQLLNVKPILPVKNEIRTTAEKKKVKKTSVPLKELVYGGMAAAYVQKALEKEFEMALQDRVMEEIKDKKNAVEAYVYDMRNKLNDKYHEFVMDSEREQFIAKLQDVEDWLYEDVEDETKGVYVAKLEELKKQGDPVDKRYKEHTRWGSVIDQLVYCINSYREAAISADPKLITLIWQRSRRYISSVHACSCLHDDTIIKCGSVVDDTLLLQVLNECIGAEAWLREKIQQQHGLPKHATPVLLSADIRKKAKALDRYFPTVTTFCRPMLTKPKPKPATPETSSPASSQGSESLSQGADNTNSSADQPSNAGETAGNEVPPPAEPMETDKSESAPD